MGTNTSTSGRNFKVCHQHRVNYLKNLNNNEVNRALIKKGLDAIAAKDGDVKKALQQLDYPEPRIRPAGFETLVSTIVSQQLSTKAASAIMGRVRDLLPELNAAAVLSARKTSLRKAGLSERKVEYIRALAKAIKTGAFDPDQLTHMDDTTAIAEITALHGFGPWSAEIYLMFSLGRHDIFPANDLALQVALQNLKQLKQKPGPAKARELVSHWAPWRSAGSLFLWHFYRGAPT